MFNANCVNNKDPFTYIACHLKNCRTENQHNNVCKQISVKK